MDQIVEAVVAENDYDSDRILEVLIQVQKESEQNYLSKEAIATVASLLKISESKVYGIARFYAMLSTKLRGKYVIQVCNSTTCHIKDGEHIAEILTEILGINMGEVTEDGLFSLEYVSCLGACDHAPSMRIDETTYGDLDRGKVFNVLATLKRGDRS